MLLLSCKIEITQENPKKRWVIDKVHSVKITGDSSAISDTCVIELPKNIKWAEEKECPIKRGDKVKVFLGYNDILKKKIRFVGIVKDVSVNVDTKISCEDYMFALKQVEINKKTYKNTTINNIIKDIVPKDIKIEISGELKIGDYRITATTVAGELALLLDNYPLTIFFEIDDDGEPTMYVFTSWINGRKNAGVFTDTTNIISHNLEYLRKEDVNVRIKGISHIAKGKKIEYAEGDGDTQVKNYYNLSLEDLKQAVKQEIKRKKYDGLKGSFTTFGEPIIKKMNTVDIKIEGAIKARYIVKGVNVTFGIDGYRQEVELQRKITDKE